MKLYYLRWPQAVVLSILLAISVGDHRSNASSDAVATRPSNAGPFEPVRAWWYKCEPLPENDSEAVTHMAKAITSRPNDPDLMEWAAVAQGKGLINTGRSTGELTLEAAKRGRPFAKARLGRAYVEGDQIPQNVSHGMTLLDESLEAGESTAALELSRIHLLGLGGIPSDYNRAEEYSLKALDLGNVRAHAALAEIYDKKGDEDRAIAALREGAEAGDDTAMFQLGTIYQKGGYGEKSNAQLAIRWITQSAERGHAGALRELGKAVLFGFAGIDRTKRNIDVGRTSLQRSANLKDPEGMRLMARLYLNAELNTPFDPGKAVELLRSSAKLGDPVSMYELAILNVEGLVIPRNLSDARKLMTEASLKDYPPADAYLRRLKLAASQPTSAE